MARSRKLPSWEHPNPTAKAAYVLLEQSGLAQRFCALSYQSRQRVMLVLQIVPPDVAIERYRLGTRDIRRLHQRFLMRAADRINPQELEDLLSFEESTWVGKR